MVKEMPDEPIHFWMPNGATHDDDGRTVYQTCPCGAARVMSVWYNNAGGWDQVDDGLEDCELGATVLNFLQDASFYWSAYR